MMFWRRRHCGGAIRTLLFLGCLISGPLSAQESPRSDSTLSLRLETVYRWIRGTTEVDEFDVEGTRLNLNEDFDIEPTAGLRLGLSKSWDRLRLDAEAEYFQFRGAGQPEAPFRFKDDEFKYDEGSFSVGVPFKIDGHFLLTRGLLAWEVRENVPGLRLIAGVEYPHFNLGVKADDGERSTEDYFEYLPYPIAGISYERKIDDRFSWETRLLGTWFAELPTYRYEGGMLKMSVREIDLSSRLTYNLSDHFSLSLGAGYWIYTTRMRSSDEDDNKFDLRSPSISLGLEYRF